MEQFKHIGLIGRLGSDHVVETLNRLIGFLEGRGCRLSIEARLADGLSNCNVARATREEMGAQCDLVIVIGGDGSLLGAARALCYSNTPVLGINRGRLGFLTDISPHELEARVTEVLEGRYETEYRFLLQASLYRNGELIGSASGLNDVVLHPAAAVRMIEFELFVDEQFVYSQRSDGLIVATPTGSTAYALSGGGPILHPQMEAIVLVPMFPHTLSSRPIVVDSGSSIAVRVIQGADVELQISCDGHMRMVVQPDDVLRIERKPEQLRLIHPPGHSFFEACRSKLGWSSRLHD
ncbi:NAD+ kinase [Kushneria sinocarnis]|uniref:NAD kinase n=1 Tax=Kushneria sinocarnis TaxID=595502 RepID=A0A420WUS5_9GAMM|nr:NAD(+) kinase [Kushneria sinocarnis]RKQ97172.1 NAD+ kinase [Kushneria sinocarnis]